MMIFVCGLSEVGKSSLIEAAVALDPNMQHVRASDLLSRAGFPTKNLTERQILENQSAFVQLATAVAANSVHTILDGHLLIEGLSGPMLLPDSCLDGLELNAVIGITADARILFERRKRSATSNLTVLELDRLMSIELDAAEKLAQRRAAAFAAVRSDDQESFISCLKNIIRN